MDKTGCGEKLGLVGDRDKHTERWGASFGDFDTLSTSPTTCIVITCDIGIAPPYNKQDEKYTETLRQMRLE